MSVAILWASLGLLAYTYAGYPLWLWLQCRFRPRPVARAAFEPDVVMVVVAHNEAARIEAKIRTCLAQSHPADKLRMLVVSDGSTDQTVNVVRAFGDPRVSVLDLPERRGKAACLNDAVAATTQEVIVFTDARQRLHRDAVRELLANLADPQVGAVSGELVFVGDDDQPFEKGIGAYWRYEKFIRGRESASGSAIGVTGALYALRRVCFEPIAAQTVLDDVAIPMAALMRGWRVCFENAAIAYDRPSTSAEQERVRKVRTLAGNFQLLALQPRLLSPLHNPAWLRFVSHKVLRLAGPALLLTALVAHAVAAVDSSTYRLLLGLHLAAYAGVGAALLVPGLQRIRLLGLAVTFAHLNQFVVLGLVSYLTNRQMQLWNRHAEVHAPAAPVRAPE